MYTDTEDQQQCLYLSEKLNEASQKIKALEADLALMGEGFRWLKERMKK
jgi:hypothetical protein